MIITLRGSVRSLWAPVVVLVGLTFSLLGVAMVAMPRQAGETLPAYLSSLVIGVGSLLLGLPWVWFGARMGVLRQGRCLVVRRLYARARTYCPDDISGFVLGEVEHDMLPLMKVQPVIVLVDGSEMALDALADYRAFPGSRRRAARAMSRLSEWTGRPSL